jgi:membrane-associated phospholipid phosphatase
VEPASTPRLDRLATVPASRPPRRWAIAQVAVIGLFFAIWAVLYDATNQHGSEPSRAVHLTRPVDRFPGIIQPWTAFVYLPGGVLLPLLPFAFDRSWRWVRFVLTGYGVAALLAAACYLAWPLAMQRPPFAGDDPGERLMRLVFVFDREANCFPSSHVYFAVLGALNVARVARQRWVIRATIVLAVAVCLTTVTTGQHYLVDIPGGIAAALLGDAVAGRIERYWTRRHAHAGDVALGEA